MFIIMSMIIIYIPLLKVPVHFKKSENVIFHISVLGLTNEGAIIPFCINKCAKSVI